MGEQGTQNFYWNISKLPQTPSTFARLVWSSVQLPIYIILNRITHRHTHVINNIFSKPVSLFNSNTSHDKTQPTTDRCLKTRPTPQRSAATENTKASEHPYIPLSTYENSVDLGNDGVGNKSDRYTFTISNRFIPLNMVLGWSAVCIVRESRCSIFCCVLSGYSCA